MARQKQGRTLTIRSLPNGGWVLADSEASDDRSFQFDGEVGAYSNGHALLEALDSLLEVNSMRVVHVWEDIGADQSKGGTSR